MKRRYFFIFNSSVLLFLLGINLYIFLQRNNGYAYQELLSAPQLYDLKEDLKVTELINKGNDSILIKTEEFPHEHSYYIELKEGKHIYEIKNSTIENTPPIKLGINYTPSKEYQKNNRTREYVKELYYSSIPVGKYKTYSLAEWQQDSPYSISEEKTQVLNLMLKNTNLKKEDSSLTKIKKTAAFILNKLDTCRGIPSDTMDLVSPFQRYSLALQGKSKVWCGDFSSILAFFLNAQKIACREVCLEGNVNDVLLAGHSFNEVYIPELKKWILVDLTSKAICLSYQGEYLNALNFYELHKNNVSSIKLETIRNDSIVSQEYETVQPFYDYYFANNPRFVFYLNKYYSKDLYSFTSKLKRYFCKDATFAVYSGTFEEDNKKFFVKQFALIGLLVYFLFFLICLASVKRH